jgi:hypothetical protein
MKNIKVLFATALFLILSNTFAQEVAPLQLGNIWVYDRISTTARTTLIDTNIYIDTIPYCKLFIEVNYGATGNAFERLKEDGFYVIYNEFDSTETPYYKKNAVIGDTWTVGTLVYSIEDTFIANVFGEQTTIKFLLVDDGLIYRQEYWTEKFGKLSSQDFGGILDDLQGCVIDGVAYGDTSFTIVSVEDEFEPTNDFRLEQNYPNPFNPATTITFQVVDFGFVSIRVYDILGKEIETLVNEEKPAGTYQITFDGSGLVSGTYFYQLKTENYIETKKMQLMK